MIPSIKGVVVCHLQNVVLKSPCACHSSRHLYVIACHSSRHLYVIACHSSCCVFVTAISRRYHSCCHVSVTEMAKCLFFRCRFVSFTAFAMRMSQLSQDVFVTIIASRLYMTCLAPVTATASHSYRQSQLPPVTATLFCAWHTSQPISSIYQRFSLNDIINK